MRAVIDALLDPCDALNARAVDLPRGVRERRLRLETAVIVNLARRLSRLLRAGDPLAARVKLRKPDAVLAVLAAMRFLP